MTVATRYNLYKKGKITKEQFLYEARKDNSVPFITPLTSFNDAVTMLKQHRIVVENFTPLSTPQSTEDPYMQGFLAAEKGADYQDCPFMQDENPEEYELWCDGWSDASADDNSENSSIDDFYNDGKHDQAIADYEDNIANSEMSRHDSEMYMQEQAPSLREQVKDFVQKAMEGGSSMDEAKEQAREYFSTEKAALNEDDMEEGKQPGADELNAAIESGKLDPKKIEDAAKKAQQGDPTELAILMFNATRGLGGFREGLNEAAKPKLGIDQVNPYELKKGTDYEMGYATKPAPSWAEMTLMDIAGDVAKAQAKALKNLNKDPMYYTRLLANGGKKEKKEKEVKVAWDGYTKGTLAAEDKANVTNKKEGPVKTPGVKVMKEGIKTNVQKIREFVTAQLKKETQLVKSKRTGATIDVVPDAQAQQIQADLQKKGVVTTKTPV